VSKSFWEHWQSNAHKLQQEVLALYLAYRDPRTPWYAKAWVGLIIAYVLSPIDLIPDFIPILGYLDDLLFVPLAIWVGLRIIPAQVLEESRQQAQKLSTLKRPWWGMLLIILLWLGGLCLLSWGIWHCLRLFGFAK